MDEQLVISLAFPVAALVISSVVLVGLLYSNRSRVRLDDHSKRYLYQWRLVSLSGGMSTDFETMGSSTSVRKIVSHISGVSQRSLVILDVVKRVSGGYVTEYRIVDSKTGDVVYTRTSRG